MKHLFIYILCAIMYCGAYAQTNVPSTSSGVKFRTMMAEKAMRSGKFGKDAAVWQQKARTAAPIVNMQGSMLRNRIGNPIRVAAPKLVNSSPIESDKARITLYVETDWGDDSGYQLILDRDCGMFGQTIVDDIFAAADYKIPENAENLENFLVAGKSGSLDIPAGEYDFYVLNPTPSERTVYIAEGESQGDNYYFKGGYEYVFTVNVVASSDNVELTCDSPVELGVSEITTPKSGVNLGSKEKVTAKIYNKGSESVSSFIAKLTVDDGETISETVNTQIAPDESIDYTFNANADLSASGIHTLTVAVDNDRDGLAGNNSVMKKVMHVAPIPAPYVCEFDEESCADEWDIIDANGDGHTWSISLNDQAAKILYSATNISDDYLVTMCPITLSAGTNKVVVNYNAMGASFYESFEILYGKTDNVKDMTVLKKFEDFCAAEEPYVSSIDFDTPETGDYYFAIHATSKPNQFGLLVYGIEISEGAYSGTPDLAVSKVVLPISSCSLGNAEKAGAVIFNYGTAGVKNFTIKYSLNGAVMGTQKFDVAVPAGESVEITLDNSIDMSSEGKYTLGIEIIDVIPDDGQNPETVTDNNYAESSAIHYTPTDVPFTVDFSNASQRDDWASDGSWIYDAEYNNAVYCAGSTPLVSRGINLKAGKTYRMSYNYMAGMLYFVSVIYDSYDIILGQDGTPTSGWNIIASYYDIYTNDAFADNEVVFTVPSDGVYSLGFRQDIPQATFMLRTISVTEVEPYDIAVTGISGLPSKLPKSLTESLTVNVAVKNNGAETASGTISLTLDGKEIGSTKFDNISIGDTRTIGVPVIFDNVSVGMKMVEASVSIDGQDDSRPSDNVMSVPFEITENVYAYDYVTEDMYNKYYVIGIDGTSSCTAGIVFHFNNKVDIKGLSIGWGITSDESIILAGYKWDPNAVPDMSGVLPVGENVFSTIEDQGSQTGQIDYLLYKPVTLEPGYYMFTVTYTGYALVVDNVTPGQLYMLVDNDGTMLAFDNTSAGLGTPAIRAILGETVGINIAETDTDTPAIVYDAASKDIVVSSSSAIKNIAVYSTSGSMIGGMTVDANTCRYDASRLSSGVYVVKLSTADGIVTGKIAVK